MSRNYYCVQMDSWGPPFIPASTYTSLKSAQTEARRRGPGLEGSPQIIWRNSVRHAASGWDRVR